MPKLIVINGEMKDQVFELTGEKATVGRLPDNMVCLKDVSISSHHAEFRWENNEYILKDLNSTNGTSINGKQITHAPVLDNNVIQFGQMQLLYLKSSTEEGERSASPKNLINLSDTSYSITPSLPQISQGDSSLTSKLDQGKMKTVIQLIALIGGIIAIVIVAAMIFRILRS